MTINNKYINAIFNFDVNAFKTLLETEPFDLSLLQDIKFAESVPCPIYWITQCWEIIFEHPEEWKENCREIIAENKRRNLEIKKIFEERFNVIFEPIDFYNTDFWFLMGVNSNDVINLVGLAAHESMYSLLSKYDPKNNI